MAKSRCGILDFWKEIWESMDIFIIFKLLFQVLFPFCVSQNRNDFFFPIEDPTDKLKI